MGLSHAAKGERLSSTKGSVNPVPRFSIRQLLIATAAIGAGIFALLNVTPLVAAGVVAVATTLLVGSLLLALFRDSDSRAFWIGFAICGWIFVFLCYGEALKDDSPYGYARIITGQATTELYDRFYLREEEQVISDGSGFRRRIVSVGPDRQQFLFIAQSLWIVLIATTGGYFAAWLHRTRPKPAS